MEQGFVGTAHARMIAHMEWEEPTVEITGGETVLVLAEYGRKRYGGSGEGGGVDTFSIAHNGVQKRPRIECGTWLYRQWVRSTKAKSSVRVLARIGPPEYSRKALSQGWIPWQ